MTTHRYFRRGQVQETARRADEAEMESVRESSVAIDRGIRNDALAEAFMSEGTTDSAIERQIETRDLDHDTLVGEVRDELRRREHVMGDAYPFSVREGRLAYRESVSGVYEFFLASTLGTNQRVQGWHRLTQLFERLAAKLVSRFFGRYATAYHVGSHRDCGALFKTAWAEIAARTGEWHWQPALRLPDSGPVSGDQGCDYVIHVLAPDDRKIAQLFVLGQCACGNNWQNKLAELDVGRLQKWFSDGGHIVPPVRTFATPLHVTDTMLEESSGSAGLIFDRARLTMLAEADGRDVIPPFSSRLRSAIRSVVG